MNFQITIRLVVFVAVSLASTTVIGSSVKIDVTTQYHDGVIPNAFNIRCAPQTPGKCAMSVVTIQVTKDDDKQIANIQSNNRIAYNPLLESSILAEGHIDRDLSKTYLSVTIKEAVAEDSGLYRCKLLYFDGSLNFKMVESSYNVTIANQDTQDIIKHLMSKISFMENLVQFQQDEMSEMKTKLVELGAQLQSYGREIHQTKLNIKSAVDVVKDEMSDLKDTQESQIASLADKFSVQGRELRLLGESLTQTPSVNESFTTAFSVEQPSKTNFAVGDTILFIKSLLNIGDGYDMDTGVFTAPRRGLYVFHLFVTTTEKNWTTKVHLKVNEEILASLHTYVIGSWEQGSVSTVTSLNAGDQVKPVAKTGSGTRLQTDGQYTYYSGYLLTLL